jgi:hypothetical protein
MAKTHVASQTARAAPIIEELERWREHTIPDAGAPLDAEDVARLVRDCFAALGLAADVASSFSVNTVHYYRRKDILDEPDGRTSAARYALRHVWQAAGARLAGFLGLVTLAEARDAMRDADEPALVAFVAERVADARGRAATREVAAQDAPRPLRATRAPVAPPAKATSAPFGATIVALGGDALCIVPDTHVALHSPSAARALVATLAAALGVDF